MANVIASLEFGIPPTPEPPVAGKKLFLGADGKLKTIAPDGTVEGVGVTGWADLQNKPSEFPPAPHTSDKITDFVPAVNDAITDLDAGTY